jgi:hypothetical protein
MSDRRAKVPARTALETAFPSAMLSAVGTHESWRKEVHRPATSTHKWWAKRLGSVFRGIIAAATTEAGGDATATHMSPANLAGTVILDPFAGSGVIGVEAVKFGAAAVCFDINPVATLVQRQALQPWDMAALNSAWQSPCVTLVGASVDGAAEIKIALPPSSSAGCYRVRAHVKNRDYGEDRDDEDPVEEYLLQIWTAPSAPEELLKATDEVGAYWRQPSG